MTDTLEPTPGHRTSEFKLATAAQILGIIGTVAPPIWTMLSDVSASFPQVRWLAAAVSMVGMIVTVLASLGYSKSRAMVKSAASKGTFVALLVGGLVLAQPARADGFLVHCFSGCDAQGKRVSADALKLDGGVVPPGGQALSSTVWIGPDVGLNLFIRDGATNTWVTNATPQFGYSLHWAPPGWTLTPSLIAIGLYAAAGSGSPVGVVPGNTFNVSLLPVVTIVDTIGVGYGPVFHFATAPGMKDGISGQLAFSFSKSFGAPKP